MSPEVRSPWDVHTAVTNWFKTITLQDLFRVANDNYDMKQARLRQGTGKHIQARILRGKAKRKNGR